MDTTTVLSPEAFVRTYSPPGVDDPWEQVEEYFMVLEWAEENPDASWYQASELLAIPRDRTKSWFEGSKPIPLQGLETVDALGWIDAPWESQTGHAFTILTGAIYGGGTLTSDFHPRITLAEKLDAEVVDSMRGVFRTLVGSYAVKRARDPDRTTELVPGADSSLLGRALHALGVPKGWKTQGHFSLPLFLDGVSDRHRREFVETYVIFRGARYEGKEQIDLREERSQSYLESLAELIENVTGESATVRENGILLPSATVRQLSLTIDFPP